MKKIGIIGSGNFGITTVLASALLSKKMQCPDIIGTGAQTCREPINAPIKKEIKPFKASEHDSDYRRKLFNSKKRYKK